MLQGTIFHMSRVHGREVHKNFFNFLFQLQCLDEHILQNYLLRMCAVEHTIFNLI